MTGNIRNRNVRFYEEKEVDRRAWEILHSEAVRAFPHKRELNENYTKGEYFRRFIK